MTHLGKDFERLITENIIEMAGDREQGTLFRVKRSGMVGRVVRIEGNRLVLDLRVTASAAPQLSSQRVCDLDLVEVVASTSTAALAPARAAAAGSRRDRRGQPKNPTCWGYSTHLDKVFRMRCFDASRPRRALRCTSW